MKRIHCLVAVAALLLCSLTPSFAGPSLAIIEGGDPVGVTIRITIGNAALGAQTGTVFAKVVLANGKSASQAAKVVVGGGGVQATTLQFDDEIREVVVVGIVEGPDPIPQ